MKDTRILYLRKYKEESDKEFELRVNKELSHIACTFSINGCTIEEDNIAIVYSIIKKQEKTITKIKGFKDIKS